NYTNPKRKRQHKAKNKEEDGARKTKNRDQPKNRAQQEKPKLFTGPKALRNGGARKCGEKCLAQDCTDRQEKNGEDEFDPLCRHRHRRGPATRSLPWHNQRNYFGPP